MSKETTILYKYIPVDYAETIINSQRLKLSDGLSFNDPFELLEIDAKTKAEKTIKGLHILCLTNSFQNKLMWSHYAKNHEGLCLAVEVPKDIVYGLNYTSKRVKTTDNVDSIIKKSKNYTVKRLKKSYSSLSRKKKIALLKDRCWEYEKEYRIVLDKTDSSYYVNEGDDYFLPLKIVRIYMGVCFEKNDKKLQKSIISACAKHKVEIRNVKKSIDNYSMRYSK